MYRKAYLFFFIALLISYHSGAQMIPYLGFSAGLYNPIGSYTSTNFSKDNSGFASSGTGIAILAGLQTQHALSFDLEYAVVSNKLDVDAFANSINTLYSKSFQYFDEPVEYKHRFLLGGISVHGYFKDHLIDLYTSAKIGYAWSERPSFSIYMNDFAQQVRYIYSDVTQISGSMAFGIEAGLNLRLEKILMIGIHGGFMSCSPTYNRKASNSNGTFELPYKLAADQFFIAITSRINLESASQKRP